MRDEALLTKLENDLVNSANRKAENKEAKKQALLRIAEAKKSTNPESIEMYKKAYNDLASRPEVLKAEVTAASEKLKQVKSRAHEAYEIEEAKQEHKEAKLRLKSCIKEVKQAKKAYNYAEHVGDSNAIVSAQEEINNIKLNLIRERLNCERVVCDAKAYIRKQQNIIKTNAELVKAQEESAINETKEAKEEILKAKEIIKKAKKILPPFSGFTHYYNEHIQAFEAFFLLAPAMCLLLLFMIFPLFNTGMMAFMENFKFLNKGGIFAVNHSYTAFGIGEFVKVLKDPVFIQALKNTVIMVIVSVPLTVLIALFISVALNGVKKLQGMYQTIFFLPYVTNTIALGMVFKVMFATNGGLINLLFDSNTAWLTDPTSKGYWTSLVVITVYTIWNGLAFKILIFLSGLQSIDKQYYDAALIDGASKSRIFRKITVPLLSPMILYTVITSFIGAFKAYSSVIAVFGRGPNVYGPAGAPQMWITVVGYIYDQMPALMQRGALSRASAGAVILLVIILLITIVQFAVSKKRVHY